jgi:hypothetical protein
VGEIATIDFEKYALSPEIGHEFENYEGEKFVLDADYSASELELEKFVGAVESVCVGTSIIIIADTTNINVDPYTYCVYYLGGNIKTKCFDEGTKKCEMFYKTNISDIKGWLEFGGFRIYEKELEQLEKFGIVFEHSDKKSVNKKEEGKDIDNVHNNKYISKINILVPDSTEFLKIKKNFFKTNNFQYCTEIEDAKSFFKEYKQKSIVIEDWDIAPNKISWFCIQNLSFDCVVLIETRRNKPNSEITYFCRFPHRDDKDVESVLKKPIKADIRNPEDWMREIKVRMTPKRKEFLERCLH